MRNSHPPACALLSRAVPERHLPQGDPLPLERATMTLANLLATVPQSSRARAVDRHIVDDMNQHRDAVDPLAVSRLAALAQSETTRLMEYCEDGHARHQLQACLDRIEEATEL